MSSLLSEQDVKVIAAAQHRADADIQTIAKLTGLKITQVRYSLQKLIDRKVITGRGVFADVYRLGYTYFTFAFSLHAEKQADRDKAIRSLRQSPHIAFLAAVSGDHQYMGTACLERVDELWGLFSKLSDELGAFIHEKCFGAHLWFRAYGRRALTTKKIECPIIQYGSRSSKPLELTDIDYRLLRLCSADSSLSLRDLSKTLRAPTTTIHRHLNRLKGERIIIGDVLRIDLSQRGMTQYKLLLFARGMSDAFARNLAAFCDRDAVVLRCIGCIGAWDYEIDIEVASADELPLFQQRLFAAMGTELNSVRSLQIIKHLGFSAFPIPISTR